MADATPEGYRVRPPVSLRVPPVPYGGASADATCLLSGNPQSSSGSSWGLVPDRSSRHPRPRGWLPKWSIWRWKPSSRTGSPSNLDPSSPTR
ncbi:hypothetical protein [Brasilonema sp. UFV-L1]|uniref:hypothetical protein n=1 Tax=Brasilonema sp. UFV-L1 TaxID=2234130 RepID=UPI00145F0CCD|nr:hypothetical protein [Brasilonema sp. UFV-L1]